MPIDLNELERLAQAATPLPWHTQSFDVYGWKNKRRVFVAQTSKPIMRGIENIAQRLKDADYIVAACNALPELTARVRELERQKRVLVEKMAIDILCSECPVSETCPYENATFIDLDDCAKQLEKWSENAAKEVE